MNKSLYKTDLKSRFITILLLFIIAMFLINPEKYTSSVYNGMLLFVVNVLPALFPFFFLTKLLTSVGNVGSMTAFMQKPVKKILKMPPQFTYIFFMSILSGYPIGAKLVSEISTKNSNKTSVTRLASVCSTSGPIFIIGTIGFSMLNNKNAGFILYASHILAVLLFAFISGFFFKKNEVSFSTLKTDVCNDKILSESIYSSVISIMMVGGFISVFYMFIDMLGSMVLFSFTQNLLSHIFTAINLPSDISQGFLNGFVEITRGCRDISFSSAPLNIKLCFCAFMVTFSGLCIFMQTFAFLSGKIKYLLFIAFKFIQSVSAALICFLLCLVFNI